MMTPHGEAQAAARGAVVLAYPVERPVHSSGLGGAIAAALKMAAEACGKAETATAQAKTNATEETQTYAGLGMTEARVRLHLSLVSSAQTSDLSCVGDAHARSIHVAAYAMVVSTGTDEERDADAAMPWTPSCPSDANSNVAPLPKSEELALERPPLRRLPLATLPQDPCAKTPTTEHLPNDAKRPKLASSLPPDFKQHGREC